MDGWMSFLLSRLTNVGINQPLHMSNERLLLTMVTYFATGGNASNGWMWAKAGMGLLQYQSSSSLVVSRQKGRHFFLEMRTWMHLKMKMMNYRLCV
jgi:hypothetical protein